MSLRGLLTGHNLARLVAGYRGVIALRWAGIVILLISALTTPHPVWLPGSLCVVVAAAGYNLAAMAVQHNGFVSQRVRLGLLCADFVGCLWRCSSILSAQSGAGPAESVGLLLIGVEAVVLFDLWGYAWFSAAAAPALALAAWDQARSCTRPTTPRSGLHLGDVPAPRWGCSHCAGERIRDFVASCAGSRSPTTSTGLAIDGHFRSTLATS